MTAVFFYLAGAGALGTAVGVITQRNPFLAALALILHLASLAVLFLVLQADFLAAAQVLVYAGAVMIMFLFVIAYLGDRAELELRRGSLGAALAITAGLAILIETFVAVSSSSGILGSPATVGDDFGSPARVGQTFLTNYQIGFELVSIVLLVGAVAGVVLGASRLGPERDARQAAGQARARERLRAREGRPVSPGLSSWILLSAALFAVGLIGVMLRRSPLVILLSIEIMLNAGNLLLIAGSRYAGGNDGQVFALVVMGVAAAEVVVGLGLIVALSRAKVELDVDELRSLHGMTAAYAAWIALLAPLAGLAFTIAIGSSVSRKTVGVIASGAMLGAFVASCVALFSLLSRSPGHRVELSTGWHWLSAGTFQSNVSILVDPLSVIMLLVVTGVGFLIHAYSVGYMHGDREERRFFAYLNLFVFSMLVLVLAGDFIILLAGWGLVGLSSYLLIGFWWERPSAVAAAKKAFIMNAIGDIGIALGLFVIWDHVHSLDYLTVFGKAGGPEIPIGSHTANWIALLLLVGAVAKSAQLPLQTWLPDAMEGPTPVSALIHAATMVTAGVYLVARMWPLYTAAPQISDLVALIGVATLTMAGLIALVQTDIKRVIAYSTMSQIGYMFCAVGIGAYSAGIYHLLTHAFFKALLFLGAGVVIHALEDEQDIRKMGGLRRFMPYTAALMWIGGLALAGIPPFAGFFSKDQILADAMHVGGIVGWIVWSLGLVGAFVTSIYTFRLLLRVFSGAPSPTPPRSRRSTPRTARGRSRCSGRSACSRSARPSRACSRSRA